MAKKTRTLSGNNPKIKINLKELFGRDLPDSLVFRESFGQAVIDRIIERTTEERVGVNGKSLKAPYSNSYSKSLGFKAFGKSKNTVNMTLSGDMLGSIDIIEQDDETITIGFNDELQAAKAHGHITGNVGVKRDFFGLPDVDLEKLKKEFENEIPEDEDSSEDISRLLTLRSFLGD